MNTLKTMEGKALNPYSVGSFYCECFFNDMLLSSATCFFIKRNGQVYLVTNYHVLSGRNPETGETLDKTYAALPNRIKVYVPQAGIGEEVLLGENEFKFFDLEEDGNQLWKYTQIKGKIIDVAMLKVDIEEKYLINSIEEIEQPLNENTEIEIASPLYIIGFPFGRIGGVLPIWKKASVASEPHNTLGDGLPYFWADTATRSGMSGSPVIYYEKRPFILETNGKRSDRFTKFVGIYSGRIGDEKDAQLGKVWKPSCIDKILEMFN